MEEKATTNMGSHVFFRPSIRECSTADYDLYSTNVATESSFVDEIRISRIAVFYFKNFLPDKDSGSLLHDIYFIYQIQIL